MTTIPDVALTSGTTIPQLGFGVWQVAPADTVATLTAAFDAGYRHVDTAQMYGNEKEVGEAVRVSGLDRADVFLTSKLSNSLHRPDDARRSFDRTLADLGTDYVDLFLVHWPLPTLYDGDYVSTWRTLEEFARDGRARAIGVSNFEVDHLQRVIAESDTTPAVNQIELHPYFRNASVAAWGEERGIVTEAWSPLAQGRAVGEPVVVAIAERLGRTPGQVVLRWHLQAGRVVFPKSTTPERIRANAALFDFELTAEDVAAIDALDRGEPGRIGPHPATFAWAPA